jgi:hypothetical protein
MTGRRRRDRQAAVGRSRADRQPASGRRRADRQAASGRHRGDAAAAWPASAGDPAKGWRGAIPEIIIAGVLVVAAGIAGYALAGPAAPGAVAIGAAVVILIGLRGALPARQELARPEQESAVGRYPVSFTAFWRKRTGLADATQSLMSYDAGLRPTLQHLLAARLAERHGVSLRDDPELARRLLCQDGRHEGLWYWVDPARPAIRPGSADDSKLTRRPGIPPRTLALLIDRLEQL